jgi:hypothetical protein
MKPVLERRHHTEISTSAANGPEEIRIGILTGFELSPIHCYKLRRYQVVARGPVLRHQLPLSSAKGEAGNSYGRTTARRGGEAESLRCLVQVTHQCACLCAGHALVCVDFDSVHPGKVDHYPGIAHAEPSPVMASATHGQRQILDLGKFERPRDIGCAGTTHDQRGTLIECAVKDQAHRFIVG